MICSWPGGKINLSKRTAAIRALAEWSDRQMLFHFQPPFLFSFFTTGRPPALARERAVPFLFCNLLHLTCSQEIQDLSPYRYLVDAADGHGIGLQLTGIDSGPIGLLSRLYAVGLEVNNSNAVLLQQHTVNDTLKHHLFPCGGWIINRAVYQQGEFHLPHHLRAIQNLLS